MSAEFCQAVASATLDWYCLFSSSSERKSIARVVPDGSSDGVVMRLPEDICCSDLRELAVDPLEVGEHGARGHLGGDPLAHTPTRPVRLMSVSIMSSIAVSTRAEAW